MGEKKNGYRTLGAKLKGNRPLGRGRSEWNGLD
jgi:hypothetical protein